MTDTTTEAEMVAFYLAAEKKVLKGKRVEVEGKLMGREDLLEIRKGRKEWEARLADKLNTGISSFGVANFN